MKHQKKSELYCHIAELYINRFQELNNTQLLLDAVDLYNQAIRYSPNCIKAYIGLAYLEFVYGSVDNALLLLNKAKIIDPMDIKVNKIISLIKKELKDKKN